MSRRQSSHVPVVGLALLRCAALFVPTSRRGEWLAEWRSELWYVEQSYEAASGGGRLARFTPVSFCLGAFRDALWLSRNLPPEGTGPVPMESARECGAVLAFAAAISMTALLMLPGARRAMLSSPLVDAHSLVQISRAGAMGSSSPTISVSDYQSWKTRTRRVFADVAFYRLNFDSTQTKQGQRTLEIATASYNLGEVLNTTLSAGAAETALMQHKPALALSHAAWFRYFGADPSIVGEVVEVEGQQAEVVGILPDEAWRITEQPDGWLLENESYFSTLPIGYRGFAIGRVAASAPISQMRKHWRFTLAGESDGFDCVPVSDRIYEPWITFLFTLILACAALPATTPLPLGDYPAAEHPLFTAMRWRRWIFLFIKIVLAIVTFYCISTSLAFADPRMSPDSSVYIQFWTSFLGLLFSFRWALRDQRRRCPACLHLLKNPVSVGHPSRNFLAWHGTEFMCGKGHGLLHIPEMATSWFSTQRWLYLDPSWKSLFPEAYLPSASIF
jgi:hypothetical protein